MFVFKYGCQSFLLRSFVKQRGHVACLTKIPNQNQIDYIPVHDLAITAKKKKKKKKKGGKKLAIIGRSVMN